MKMKNLLLHIALSVACAGLLSSCIEDAYTDSPSDQPVFSTDTLDLGTVFTAEPTATRRFLVHNPHSKQLSISDIRVSGPDADCFRLNVDGISGRTFSGVDIRGKDSIFVLVEATFPEGPQSQTLYKATVDFTTNGVTRSVAMQANGQNVVRMRGAVLDTDTRFDSKLPYQIFDSLVVSPGATLALDPGATLCFHDGAMLIVRGRLLGEGTADAPVTMAGDRTGNVVTDISFDIMSRQWTGVFFTDTSSGNVIQNTDIRNTWQGVTVLGDGSRGEAPMLTLTNCKLRNSGGLVLEVYHADVDAAGCEFAEASDGLVYLQGGRHTFANCTFANYYLFTAIGGPAIQFAHVSADAKTGLDDGSGLPYTAATFANSIVYGLGNDLSHGDLSGTDIRFRRCLLKSSGSDDDNFIECLWGEDPLYYTVREDYVFDYRLRPDSPAISAGDPQLVPARAATDRYGHLRGGAPDLGAYTYQAP